MGENDLNWNPDQFGFGSIGNQTGYSGYQNQLSTPNVSRGIGIQANQPSGNILGGIGDWFSGATGEGGIFSGQSMFGGEGSTGWVSPATQLLGVGLQGWMGMQQLDLAKENAAFQREAFNKNYSNQVQMINTQMEDRAKARYAANPNAYDRPDEYMEKNQVGDK